MVRQVVNYEKVTQVAAALKKRGLDPSVLSLCEELGIIQATPELFVLLEQWYRDQPQFQRTEPKTASKKISKMNKKPQYTDLERLRSLLRATLETIADGMIVVDEKGLIVDWNQQFVKMCRVPTARLETGLEDQRFEFLWEQLSDPQSLMKDAMLLSKKPDWGGHLQRLLFKDGRVFEHASQPVQVGTERIGRIHCFRDVTHQSMVDEELRIRQQAVDASQHGIIIIDTSRFNHPIIYVNKAFEQITGYSLDEIIGKKLDDFQSVNGLSSHYKRIELAIFEQREESVDLEIVRATGQVVWCELSVSPIYEPSEGIKHYVCVFNDITQRREMEQQLFHQATHDVLTGLPNRRVLIERVDQEIVRAGKTQLKLAILFFDLDQFKMVNDTLGHGLGDQLLQRVADRLVTAISGMDTLARFGGDEFAILLPNLETLERVEVVAQAIAKVMKKPFRIGSHMLKITSSIGISVYPRDGLNYEILMKNADLAMYHVKDHGRNTYRYFEPEMNVRVASHVKISNALQQALHLNEFHLVYQPIVSLKEHSVTAVEALIRWNSHELGVIYPGDFIQIAEESAIIIKMGDWVLETACNQAMKWRKLGLNVVVAVNLSGRQLVDQSILNRIKRILTKTGLPPNQLELELTETLLMDNIDHIIDLMNAFKKMGVRLSIDDFGTGYSSLSYLKQFPVDMLKIDQSFISDIGTNADNTAIIKAIINLSHSLNLTVLAEGVETKEQLQSIIDWGCDFAQGYYFSKPESAEVIVERLKNPLEKE